jgi:hypothetical protein
MPRGQFYTVFTMGFATALGLFGILAGIACWYWPETAAWASVAIGAPGRPATWLTPGVFAAIVAAVGVFAGYWLFQIQQAIVRWSGDRLIAKMNARYRMLAQTVGTERADELMKQEALAMVGGEAGHFNLFGRDEMLHAIRAGGVLPRQ